MANRESSLVLFNKPYNVLSQFTSEQGVACLADYLPIKNIYPAGRLDRDSEGLLLLTDDGKLQAQIADPRFKLPKTYLAQVEGSISPESMALLKSGLTLKDGITRPAQARTIIEPELWPRDPPIRKRQNIPTSWVELSIKEGRNRQVRRMLAATGFPVLRLVRVRIGTWALNGLQPGMYKQLSVNQPIPTKPKRNLQERRR